MRAEFVNPFLQATTEVIESETGSGPVRGSIGLQTSAYTSHDVTALIGVTGSVRGVVMVGMSEKTACAVVERIMGQPFPEFDELAQSGIGELGNVITGRAATYLSEAGFPSNLAPPTLVIGRGTMLSTLDIRRLVIPFETEFGPIDVNVALKEDDSGKPH